MERAADAVFDDRTIVYEPEDGSHGLAAVTPDEAERMTKAGADIVVAHMGLTTKGTIGAHTAMTLEDAAKEVTAITEAAKTVRNDVLVICHGGPIAEPDDARFILENCPEVDGFYGASSMERLPVETALTAQVEKFCSLKLPSR